MFVEMREGGDGSPSRVLSAAANGHGGQRAGRPTYAPGKAAPLRGVGDAAPYISIAVNLPATL